MIKHRSNTGCLKKFARIGRTHNAFSGYIYLMCRGCWHMLELALLLGLAPPIRLQTLISTPVRVSAPPSDKHPLQISLDFNHKDGKPELFLNQLTSKSLGSFFFIEYSVKFLYAVQK